jgi:hypothetical protein
MNTLGNNLDKLLLLKKCIENKNDTTYFTHLYIEKYNIDDNTITIVMTSRNRTEQIYFTLNTISKSAFKNIHIVLVDDSDIDKISIEKIREYPFNFDIIEIKQDIKNWINPCINYNIAFNYIRGNKIIIQNSEVCHIGDVLSYVNNNINDNEYHIFNVKNSSSFDNNNYIYINYENTNNKFDLGFGGWYQHQTYQNRCLHFLTALNRSTFNKIKRFSYDYFIGDAYDDDDLLLKIKLNNINIINVISEHTHCGGIHQYHNYSYKYNDIHIKIPSGTIEINNELFQKKRSAKNIYDYIEVSDGNTIEEMRELYNKLKNIPI